MGAPARIPCTTTRPPATTDVSSHEAIAAHWRDVHHTLAYVPRRDYRLSVDALYPPNNPDLTFALHAIYTALGYQRGGTTVTDEQLRPVLGASSEALRRARLQLRALELLAEFRHKRVTVRRTVAPDAFVTVPGIVGRALLTGTITPAAFRFYAHVVHTRAESGPQAGCALTRDEHAAELGWAPTKVARVIRELVEAGLMGKLTRPGAGYVLVPKFADPVRRTIDTRARFEMVRRRRVWKLPRAHAAGACGQPVQRAPDTPSPIVGLPPSHFVGPPGGARGVSAQVTADVPANPVNDPGLNDGAPPWDDPRARWRPTAPPLFPDNPIPRPAHLDWTAYRRGRTA
jgi:hypothetical protein